MSGKLATSIRNICREFDHDRTRMMDIVGAVQRKHGGITSEALDLIAQEVGTQRVEVESVVSFYAFFSEKTQGRIIIRLCHDVIDEMKGAERVEQAFCEELGMAIGDTTPDGRITLEHTPCIGMCDQAPAVLINDTVITNLSGEKAREIARHLKKKGSVEELVTTFGDGHNADPLVKAMVNNNIRRRGPVIFDTFTSGTALERALAMSPAEVIRDVKTSRLRGRGGAGFPTGMKWDFTRQSSGDQRYVIGNADEGEPGTFKDRAILTEAADLMFEGMAIAGYAIGAETGILYLRAEYAYLRALLEHVLDQRRAKKLLGRNLCGKPGIHFDVRIQMGAGAYVCGEESALIGSCEGLRGDPKTRPPFPAQKGYLACPTTVNNVETFCCVARILDKGPGWFAQMGSKGSPGTKLLSVSGDCRSPGIYEVPFGISLRDLLELAGAEPAAAVQVGGPSGRMVGPAEFDRTICYDDLATGGAVMVFGPKRNVVHVARRFMEFFVDESCGYCTPCRVGNTLILHKLEAILSGHGEAADLDYLLALGKTMKLTSRCGLGQTAANPVISTIENFRPAYEALIRPRTEKDVFHAGFDIQAALSESREITGRDSVIFTNPGRTVS